MMNASSKETIRRRERYRPQIISTVGLLEPGASSAAAKLLGLAPPRISDKQGPVVADEDVLDLLLGLLVDVLLVEGDEGLGDALADGVDSGKVCPPRSGDVSD
ncbi:uncharacterized protein A4U43_C08F14550 [Asparagus officinalis]|nr:uncharacterized protein A4U43_C08F14550 [Asparagus officinalis]